MSIIGTLAEPASFSVTHPSAPKRHVAAVLINKPILSESAVFVTPIEGVVGSRCHIVCGVAVSDFSDDQNEVVGEDRAGGTGIRINYNENGSNGQVQQRPKLRKAADRGRSKSEKE